DAEKDSGVLVEARDRRMEERVLRPLELPCQPFLEGDLRAYGLEVVKVLRVDLRERLRAPLPREVAAAERRPLTAVVPAAEGGDENGAAELGPRGDDQLRHSPSLVRADGTPETRGEPDRPADESRRRRDMQQHEPPWHVAVGSVLHLADRHLHGEDREESGAAVQQPRVCATPRP